MVYGQRNKFFIVDYRNNFPIHYWQTRVAATIDTDSKKPKNTKSTPIDVYYLYIQLLEILFINLRCFTDKSENFLPTLFGSTGTTIKSVEQLKDDHAWREKLVQAVCKPQNKQELIRLSKLLEQISSDYLADREFLNGFKHGFRIQHGEPVTDISVETGPSSWERLGDIPQTIIYYSQILKGNESDIEERGISFHNKILVYRLRFAVWLLECTFGQVSKFKVRKPNSVEVEFMRTRKKIFHGRKSGSLT